MRKATLHHEVVKLIKSAAKQSTTKLHRRRCRRRYLTQMTHEILITHRKLFSFQGVQIKPFLKMFFVYVTVELAMKIHTE